MKRFWFVIFLGLSLYSQAQVAPSNQASFELGEGLNFSFNDGAYKFKIAGMMQPYFAVQLDSVDEYSHYLNAKRVYFNVSGSAAEEKFSFLIQTDFALPMPLLDAWVAYHPNKHLDLYFGQKQSIANNIEMLVMEDQLQFVDRSILSRTFTNTGREFGVFADMEFKLGGVGIRPKLAVTSGDGRNSFGTDSRDVDLGGLKYSGRIELFPLGFFKDDNNQSLADLKREDKVKIQLDAAASFNDGVSNQTGEGHGEFVLYNALSQNQRPDYRKLCFDALLKYSGFSVFGEYVIATASGLTGAFLNESATVELVPTQISTYLVLGRAVNIQTGYVSKKGYGVDFRYSQVDPEFVNNKASIAQESSEFKVGLTKYIKENNLKLGLQLSQLEMVQSGNVKLAELLFQLRF